MAAGEKGFEGLRWYFQVLIVSGICGVLLALVWYQFLSPIQVEIAAKNQQLADLQKQIADNQQKLKVYESFKRESDSLQARLDELKKVLPIAKEPDEIVRQLEQSARSSGLRILNYRPRTVIEHEVYTELPIDMEMVGTYHNVGVFLVKVLQLNRIFNVSNFKIQGRATEGEAALRESVNAKYTATTFVYREEISTATPTAAK